MSETDPITFADAVLAEMKRLNDNIETLLVNGLNVYQHVPLCVSNDRVKTVADASLVRVFVEKAIESGELQLESPPPETWPHEAWSLTEAGHDATK